MQGQALSTYKKFTTNMQKRVKWGGRQKGTPNKMTNNMKSILQAIIETDLMQNIHADIKQLSPSERMKLLTSLLRYYIPPLAPENNPPMKPPIIVIDGKI
jgi:hypothetical protein